MDPELREHYSRDLAALAAAVDPADPVATFLSLACLRYEGDERESWVEAARLLAANPALTKDVYVAAAACDVEALSRILAADPSTGGRPGGPFAWDPLMYLAYARHDPAVPEAAVVTSARLLLDAGAHPDAGYLSQGAPTPFTVLTGVFGHGERGPDRQPPHPHSLALARTLLEAGADANDGQTLYNRMFEPDDDHLELLYEFGLGQGDGGRWYRLLGDELDPPAELVRHDLAWAITHGLGDRVRLHVAHGVDLAMALEGGVGAASLAATTSHPELVDYLLAHGSPPVSLSPVDAFVAAALAGDRGRVEQLRQEHSGVLRDVRRSRPALVVWAAAVGRVEAVELLVELGFDVNRLGRSDVPSDQRWQTALHHAAGNGDLALAAALLALGADPGIRDARFDGTPLDWARHFARESTVELLEPLTSA